MMLLSNKAVSALEAILDIACNARPDPVRSSEIAERIGRPQRYLEKAMQQLASAGILKGVRGPKGGYMLARERRRIPVGEILRIVADSKTSADSDNGRAKNKDAKNAPCGMTILEKICEEAESEFLARLDNITIEDLCAEQRNAAIKNLDFTI
ncbi:MAG: Rrf2 family transcriptional regulator [Hyphomicrobiales bacterium]|nr:Rrf2 family transcriptional regulator [Hyphomicrobiales bacterium]